MYMLLLTIFLLTVLFSAIGTIITVVIGGGVLLVMFGDVIVFLAIVALILKLVRRSRCKNE